MTSLFEARYWRAAFTYHPEIGMFGGKRGAWRVHHCSLKLGPMARLWPAIRVWPVEEHQEGETTLMLYMSIHRPLRAHTFVNPAKLLRETLDACRIERRELDERTA